MITYISNLNKVLYIGLCCTLLFFLGGYYFGQLSSNLLIIRLFLALGFISVLLSILLRNYFDKKVAVSFNNSVLYIKYYNKNDELYKEKKISFSDLKSYSIHYPNNEIVSLDMKYTNGKKRGFAFCLKPKRKSVSLQTKEILSAFIKEINTYNLSVSLKADMIKRRLSFLASNRGLVLIILFIVLLFVSIYIKVANAKSLGITIPLSILIIAKVLLMRKREIDEMKQGEISV